MRCSCAVLSVVVFIAVFVPLSGQRIPGRLDLAGAELRYRVTGYAHCLCWVWGCLVGLIGIAGSACLVPAFLHLAVWCHAVVVLVVCCSVRRGPDFECATVLGASILQSWRSGSLPLSVWYRGIRCFWAMVGSLVSV